MSSPYFPRRIGTFLVFTEILICLMYQEKKKSGHNARFSSGRKVHSSAVFLCRAVGLASVAPGVRWPPCARGGYDPPVRGVGGCGSLPPLRCVGAAGCLVLAAICPPSKVAAVSSLPSACEWLRFVRSLLVCRGRPPLFLKIRCGCRRRSEAPPCKLVKQI